MSEAKSAETSREIFRPSLAVKVEVSPGTDIIDASREAALLATRLMVMVDFDFNGVHCCAQPHCDPADLADKWRDALNSGSKYPMAVAHGTR